MFHVNGMTHGIKVSYESFYCAEKIKNNVPIDQHKKCKGDGNNNSLPDKLVKKRDCTENMSKQSKLCGQTKKKNETENYVSICMSKKLQTNISHTICHKNGYSLVSGKVVVIVEAIAITVMQVHN